MPKRVGFLYEKLCDKDLIRRAIDSGAKNKRNRRDVAIVLANKEKYVEKMYELVVNGTFVPTKPKLKEKYDFCSQKVRTIEVVPFFPDGIMHQMIVMVSQPILSRGMYHWSCASIPGRGTAYAQKYVKRIIRRDVKGTKYVLKIDIKKFYPSVNIKKLIWALARKIKDKKFLKLIYEILETCSHGIAIGFYICQWFANYYLETLDHYILTLPGVKYMVRYMDDIVIFGPNKKKLHKARQLIAKFMEEKLGLQMKENWQVWPLNSRMLDFVGYRFSRQHTIMRKRNFLRFTRQCRRIQKQLATGKKISFKQAASLLSRAGQLKHCNSYKIRSKYLDPIGIKNLKEVVRSESKRRQRAA